MKLEQDKLITKRQVMDFLNMNDKLKQIRERLVDPGTSQTSQAKWTKQVVDQLDRRLNASVITESVRNDSNSLRKAV